MKSLLTTLAAILFCASLAYSQPIVGSSSTTSATAAGLSEAATGLGLADTTPLVDSATINYKCTDTTQYSDFVDASDGHSSFTSEFTFFLFAEDACGLDCTSSNITCNNGADWTATAGDSAICSFSTTNDKWACNVSSPATDATDLACTECVDRSEMTETALLAVTSDEITAVTDTISCGSTGFSHVILTADSTYTLTSNPQIAAGGAGHICSIEWNDATDALTIVDGNGVNNYGDQDKVLSVVGQTVWYYYTGSVWQELAPILPGCTYTFPSGVPTLDCGQTTTVIRIVDTEFIPVGWCNDGSSGPAAIAEHGQVDYRDFDTTSAEDLLCSWKVPEDLDETVQTDVVKVKAIYTITNATTPAASEGVSWGFAACSSGVGDTIDCAEGAEVNSETADLSAHAQWDVVEDSYVEVGVTNLAAGEYVRFSLQRDVADADDDYGQDVGLIGFMIKFYRSPGSITY